MDMDEGNETRRTPGHLWIVGGLSLVWNSFGAIDYTMTRLGNTAYLARMGNPQVILDYIDSFPLWAQAGWGFGVWGALAGSILLLLRHRWSVAAFGVSLLGALASLGYQLAGPPAPEALSGGASQVVPLVILAVAAGLFLYARAMKKRGVLR
jgi:hypothetical protein